MANKETFVLCDALGKGRVCPRIGNLQGACGKGDSIKESRKLVGEEVGRELPAFDACSVALNYLLRIASGYSGGGGPVTVENSEDGKILTAIKGGVYKMSNGKFEDH